MTKSFGCAVGLVSWVAIIAPASAGTIYNSFLPGNTYNCCAGNLVTGASATNGGTLVGLHLEAGAFTPGYSGTLTQIDVAFYFGNGPNTNGFILSLNQDAGGVPGTTIESWTGLTAPSQFPGTSSLVNTVFPVSPLTLSAGTQYWIVATPAASDTFDVWAINNGGLGSPGGREARNSGAGWSVINEPFNLIAFDVQGTAPEPGTWALLGLGLLALGLRTKGKTSAR